MPTGHALLELHCSVAVGSDNLFTKPLMHMQPLGDLLVIVILLVAQRFILFLSCFNRPFARSQVHNQVVGHMDKGIKHSICFQKIKERN